MADPNVTEQAAESQRCVVCEQFEPDARLLERCFLCDNPFHLNPRNDVEGIDHGDAWIGPSLGIYFYCRTCIEGMNAEQRGAMGDPAQAAAQLTAGQLGVEPPAGAPAPPATAEDGPPPRPVRDAPRRRYRRIDRP